MVALILGVATARSAGSTRDPPRSSTARVGSSWPTSTRTATAYARRHPPGHGRHPAQRRHTHPPAQLVYPNVEPTPDPITGETPAPQPIGVEPAVPTVVAVSAASLRRPRRRAGHRALGDPAMGPGAGFGATSWLTVASFYDDGRVGIRRDDGGGRHRRRDPARARRWWLASGRAGAGLRPLADPARGRDRRSPFLARPLEASWAPPRSSPLGGILIVARRWSRSRSALIDRIADANDRRLVTSSSARCAVGAAVLVARRRAVPDAWPDIGHRPLGARRGDPDHPGPRRRRADPARDAAGTARRRAGRAPRVDRVRGRRRDARSSPSAPTAPGLSPVPAVGVLAARPRRRPVHGPAARPARHAGRRSSATSSSPRPRRSAPASPPTSTTTRSRS